jgi:hypothetical protein
MKKILYLFAGGMLGMVMGTILCLALLLIGRRLGIAETNSVVSFLVVAIFLCSWLSGTVWALFRYWGRNGHPPALKSYLENRS